MLPLSHIAYTWLAASLARSDSRLPEIDYRLLAIAATAPDLVDKPLAAAYFYRHYKSAVLFAHTLIANLAIIALTAQAVRRGRSAILWIYTTAVVGHAILDRLWYFPDTFYWPFRGWRFHVWGKRGSEQEKIGLAYWYAFTRRPELWGWELGGLLALIWFILRHRLHQPEQLRDFLLHGRVTRPQ